MKNKFFNFFFLIASLGGVLFSGYISYVKFFSKICAFGETCPLFLGAPACYFGFGLFLTIFILSIVLITGKGSFKILSRLLYLVSLIGSLFSGYFALEEIPLLRSNGFSAYVFSLPTCILGFLFFFTLFCLSLFFRKQK